MNERKQKQLLAAARACTPAVPPPHFSSDVLAVVAREDCRPAPLPLFDQLSVLFPRIVAAGVVIVSVAIAFELYDAGDVGLELAQLSEQWLLPLEWL
jgi:hypothetical protein